MDSADLGHVTSDVPSPRNSEVETQFSQIAGSHIFKTAPLLRSLLVYLWKHRAEPISEYSIAVEALGRKADFDPKCDAAVRVQIARLRVKLNDFYQDRGEAFPLRLSIPVGGHVLVHSHSHDSIPPAAVLEGRKSRFDFPGMFRGVALVFLGFVLAFLCYSFVGGNFSIEKNPRATSSSSPPPLPQFWQSFLTEGKVTNVVVPTLMFFEWPEQRVSVRDRTVADFVNWPSSDFVSELAERWGTPILGERFVSVEHLLPAGRLIQYLERHGRPTQLLVSPKLDIDSYRNQNTIVVGGPQSTNRFQAFFDKSNFQIVQASPVVIRNLNPKPGEPETYREFHISDRHDIFPGIIALSPESNAGAASLLLIARNSSSLVSMLLSTDGLKALSDLWEQNGRPEAWQMIVQVEVAGDTVLNVRPVGFRATAASTNPMANSQQPPDSVRAE